MSIYGPTHGKTYKMIYAPSEDSDQPGHPPSLIRVFAVRSMGSYEPKLFLWGQRRRWSDWANAGRIWHFVFSCASSYALKTQLSHPMTKPTKWHLRLTKTQIILDIHPIWSESSLPAWLKLGPYYPFSAHQRLLSDRAHMPFLLTWAEGSDWAVMITLRPSSVVSPSTPSNNFSFETPGLIFFKFLPEPSVNRRYKICANIPFR